jgi:hypothetical protein
VAEVSHLGATVSDVNPLTTFVRSLGNDGALANARAVLDAREREDWLVQGLASRLDRAAPSDAVPAAVAATRTTAVA